MSGPKSVLKSPAEQLKAGRPLTIANAADGAEGLVLLEQAARGAPSDSEIRRRLAQARTG